MNSRPLGPLTGGRSTCLAGLFSAPFTGLRPRDSGGIGQAFRPGWATVRYPSLFVLPFSPLGAYPFLRAFWLKKAKGG